MKALAITFGIAFAIIGAAIFCETPSSDDICKTGQTLVTQDQDGRTIMELTLEAKGKKWQEVSKIQTSYSGNVAESISYEKNNGEWIATQRTVSQSSCDSDHSYALDKIIVDDNTYNDMLFDANGNLIMLATYQWTDSQKHGISKQEYEYNNQQPTKISTYAWDGKDWNKQTVSNLVFKNVAQNHK